MSPGDGVARDLGRDVRPVDLHRGGQERDEQRAGELRKIDLPPDNSPVPIEFTLDLSEGHELVLLVEMPQREAFAPARRLARQLLLFGLATTLLLTTRRGAMPLRASSLSRNAELACVQHLVGYDELRLWLLV